MGRCPTIQTERLTLRPFVEADLDEYTAVLRSAPVRASLDLPADFGRDDAWQTMAVYLGQWELRGTGQWAVEETASGRFVGRCGLHNPERVGWPGTEVGWTFDPEVWGRGYATESARAAVRYAFEVVGVGEVVSTILPDNLRSAGVARRLGMTIADTRVLPHLPTMTFDIWTLPRATWASSPG